MALKYTEERQKQICEAWQQSSGISMKQFCHENKVSKSGLYKWLNKYGHKKQINRDLKMLCACREDPAPEMGLEILLPNGVLVRGDNVAINKLIMSMVK
jgi:transposase-like protein